MKVASNNALSGLFYRHPKWVAYLAMVLSLFFIMLAISRQSLWIDEAITATYAMQGSFSSFAKTIWTETKSEAQLPLGMGQAFLFEKLFGHSEYALRLPNIFWLGLGILAFGRLGKKIGIPWLPLLIGVHPMVWFYADEARPYAMQIGIAAVLLWASVDILTTDRIDGKTLIAWWSSSLALCASSLMAAILYSVWFLVFVFAIRGKIYRLSPSLRAASITAIALLGLLAGYYARTVWRGAGGARLWDVGLSNVAFMIFEFGGFIAFSPGRIAIREAAKAGPVELLAVMRLYLFPLTLLMMTYGAVLTSLLYALRKPVTTQRRVLYFCLLIMLISTITVLSICLIVRFPFWGRHMIALLPLMCLVIAYAIHAAHPRYRSILFMLATGFLLTGSLNQRFSEQHRKDDYRSAVHAAQSAEADGLKVLWVANIEAASYYGYSPTLTYQTIDDEQNWQGAEVVIYSKPDIFDVDGLVARWMRTSGYEVCDTWPAFTLWRRIP